MAEAARKAAEHEDDLESDEEDEDFEANLQQVLGQVQPARRLEPLQSRHRR